MLCRRRGRESECTYTLPRQRRNGQNRASISDSVSNSSPSLQLGEALAEASPNDAEIAIESLLTLSGSRSAPKTPVTEAQYNSASAHAPVPKLARLLRDGHGKFIFVGDSSNLAFLQNIRRLARIVVGECGLTSDPMRHAMIEAIPPDTSNSRSPPTMQLKPTKEEAEEYVHHYMLATSGAVDLFDKDDISQHLSSWTEVSTPSNNSTDSIFYLVLAIGARNRSTDHDELAEQYFNRGRELAISSFMDDPSVLTVQSYVLIAFYLLTCCRRNGAFMLLGIAVRAAYALGLHRSDISALFEAREKSTRDRVWKSLRVLDLFLSASLGRPPATSEVDGGNVAWESKARVYENVRMGSSHSSAMLRICFIFERILNEVYCRREVDVQLVNSISAQYRDWNMTLEAGFDIQGLTQGELAASSNGLQQIIGLAHLKCAYYWSIVLLTRPFLVFDVSSKIQKDMDEATAPLLTKQGQADTTTLSEACVDAALRCIEVATDVVHAPGSPKRPFMVTNAIFLSALVIGLAIFGDYDKTFPLLSSLEQSKVVLGQLAKHDPSARRYFIITSYLQQASVEHTRRRDEQQTRRRQQGIQSLFGDLLNRNSSTINSNQADGLDSTMLDSRSTSAGVPQESSFAQLFEAMPEKKGPTLTTSGTLALGGRDSDANSLVNGPNDLGAPDTGLADDDAFLREWIPTEADAFNFAGNTEEFPLFSLMNDYTNDEGYLDLY